MSALSCLHVYHYGCFDATLSAGIARFPVFMQAVTPVIPERVCTSGPLQDWPAREVLGGATRALISSCDKADTK